MTPEVALPAISPSARFIGEQPQRVISAPSSQEVWRAAILNAVQDPRGLAGILISIDALQLNEDEDGYVFKPKPYASKNAKARIKFAYAVLDKEIREQMPPPNVVPDGTGGIIIQWNQGERALSAGFRPSSRLRDYIYYESGDVYRKLDFSLRALTERLAWLIG